MKRVWQVLGKEIYPGIAIWMVVLVGLYLGSALFAFALDFIHDRNLPAVVESEENPASSPSSTPLPSIAASSQPVATVRPTASAKASPTPTPSATASPTTTPSPSPSATPTITPSPTPSQTATPSVTPSPSPSATPES